MDEGGGEGTKQTREVETMELFTELSSPKFSTLNLTHWCHQPGHMNYDPIKLQTPNTNANKNLGFL